MVKKLSSPKKKKSAISTSKPREVATVSSVPPAGASAAVVLQGVPDIL
jgi:hypothetical protein